MCNQSAAELIARLKRLIRRMCHPKGIAQVTGYPRREHAFSTDTRGNMVTVLTATEKDVSYRRDCGTVGWMGLREFYGYTMRFWYEQSGL